MRPLTTAQEKVLWTVAQHKYGWAYMLGIGRRSAAMALVRRGLLALTDFDDRFTLTSAGEREVCERWPKSPAALLTYVPPEGGWDLLHA